ncbi:GNAT family N-acetyltransferase [Methylomonas sp. MgM2]
MKTADEINVVAALAREIWTQHFTPIIGAAQVDYMLRNFQSAGAIQSQISGGGEYYLASIEHLSVGYMSLIPDSEKNEMMISKIYLKRSARGVGIGKSLLDFAEQKCVKDKIGRLWLTVNRFNAGSISWYQYRGFDIVDEVKKDIGDGFFMDDFIMEKSIRSNGV